MYEDYGLDKRLNPTTEAISLIHSLELLFAARDYDDPLWTLPPEHVIRYDTIFWRKIELLTCITQNLSQYLTKPCISCVLILKNELRINRESIHTQFNKFTFSVETLHLIKIELGTHEFLIYFHLLKPFFLGRDFQNLFLTFSGYSKTYRIQKQIFRKKKEKHLTCSFIEANSIVIHTT